MMTLLSSLMTRRKQNIGDRCRQSRCVSPPSPALMLPSLPVSEAELHRGEAGEVAGRADHNTAERDQLTPCMRSSIERIMTLPLDRYAELFDS